MFRRGATRCPDLSISWSAPLLDVIDRDPWTVAFYILITISCAVLLAHRWHQSRRVRSWVNGLATVPLRSEREIAIVLAGRLRGMCRQTRRDPLMPIVGSVLGATPGAVLKHGGCCAGLSRLCIVSLAELGIRSRQITLYHRGTRKAQHCLVEVFPVGDTLIVDPVYGLYYEDSDGRGIGLASLQKGIVPIVYQCHSGAPGSYPPYPYYDFDFAATKTANWTKSRLRRVVYRLVHTATRGAIDTFRLPPWLEWPQLQFVVLITIAATIHAGALLLTDFLCSIDLDVLTFTIGCEATRMVPPAAQGQ